MSRSKKSKAYQMGFDAQMKFEEGKVTLGVNSTGVINNSPVTMGETDLTLNGFTTTGNFTGLSFSNTEPTEREMPYYTKKTFHIINNKLFSHRSMESVFDKAKESNLLMGMTIAD